MTHTVHILPPPPRLFCVMTVCWTELWSNLTVYIHTHFLGVKTKSSSLQKNKALRPSCGLGYGAISNVDTHGINAQQTAVVLEFPISTHHSIGA